MPKDFTHADYVPHFTGHETFHMRYGWLKKAFDKIKEAGDKASTQVFSDGDAIARFGVGKNMVASIRYWAVGCDVLEGKNGSICFTPFGDKLFSNQGLDPFLENASSLWLLHWKLATNIERTSYYWTFNYFNEANFSKKSLSNKLIQFAEKSGWKMPALNTIEKDFAVLLSTYSAGTRHKRGSAEDSLTSPLAELGLIRSGIKIDDYHLGWGPKPSLSDGAFLFALLDFWNQHSTSNTLNFQTILLEPGSPGRVFLMDENDLAVRLMNLDALTGGKLAWSETAGMRQIVRNKAIDETEKWQILAKDFGRTITKAA